MDVSRISGNENEAVFLIEGTSAAFVNSMRRAIMNSVPTLAIEDIMIYANSSVVFDEMLANRLGFIPLKADLGKYKDEKDTVKITLEKEGPCTVYSGDLKIKDSEVEVVDKKIVITELAKGQKIMLEAEAVPGTGREHVKWQPAIASYKGVPILKAEKGSSSSCKESIKACPVNVLEIKGDKLSFKEPYTCILCGKCRDVCRGNEIKIETDKEKFLMSVESNSGIPVGEIMIAAAEAISHKAALLRKEIKKL